MCNIITIPQIPVHYLNMLYVISLNKLYIRGHTCNHMYLDINNTYLILLSKAEKVNIFVLKLNVK